MFPGTETMAGYSDYTFHLRAFLKGTVGGVFLALLGAAVTMGIGRLL